MGGSPRAASRRNAPEASTVISDGSGWSIRQNASARFSLPAGCAVTACSPIRAVTIATCGDKTIERARDAPEDWIVLFGDAKLGCGFGDYADGVAVEALRFGGVNRDLLHEGRGLVCRRKRRLLDGWNLHILA